MQDDYDDYEWADIIYYFVKYYYHIKDKCYIYSWAYKCIKHTHISVFAGLFLCPHSIIIHL